MAEYEEHVPEGIRRHFVQAFKGDDETQHRHERS